ncbi:hypothetical protein [Methanovulcanius yangii]|uniref:hypothetical protein n=1 Tax=Methanovulcanius yangii TaxID=1789227 RepID=UPI0029CA83C5|nr:hypothetical protein [Methanovulcanius yangii]
MVGRTAAAAVSVLLIAYLITLTLGLLSLASPLDPIGDPYFSLMESLIIIIAPLMVVVMVAVHAYAAPEAGIFSLSALAFMSIMAAITCSVHFVILTVRHLIESAGFPWVSLFFSFTWPSVVYTLDILAWDIFFALAMLCAAPVFRVGRLERTVRALMIVSGVLSLAGLVGVPLADMGVRNIGIIGYAVVSIFVFFLIAMVFSRNGDRTEGE